ncbi:zinc finger protein ZFP2-like [Lutzomyia longipalpis]|uniref:zinc finger protein ZFP2-like n=1 Tax=Lutzomyia longipalpis TaxID=7200 RepID=UPI002483A0D6|nr:zinc finger protein ZFP2-like [Lutzomyia longipalpis]
MEPCAMEDPFFGSCRVCLSKNASLSTIFEVLEVQKIGEMTLSDMILLLCGLKIDAEDGMPGTICEGCRLNLLAAFEFRLLCLKSDEDMRTFVYKKEAEEVMQEVQEVPEGVEIEVKGEEEVKIVEEAANAVVGEEETPVEEYQELKNEVKDEDDSCDVGDDDGGDGKPNSPPGLVPIDPGKKKRKNAKREHICQVCGKVFDKAYRLLRHVNIHNAKGKPFECAQCKQRFASESNLLRHQIVHSNLISETTTVVNEKPKSFQCFQCDRVFMKQESLASHMKTHKETMQQIEFKCEYCEKTFTKMNFLTRHIKSHEECKSHKCNICGKTFALGGLLIDHINRHKGLKPHVCEICNKRFQQSCTLKDHMRIHSGDTPYLCSECGKAFNNGSNLRQHLIRHSGVKPFACTQCPSRFSCKGGLKSHLTTHSGLKPYVCDSCGHSFTKPYSLVKHKRIHTGERPYSCEVCEMKFNSSDHVRRHMRTHTGEKPYKCKFCDRAFAQSNDLVKHIRSHVGEKTYQCNQCSTAFRLYSELRVHIREHFAHGEIPSDALVQKSTKGVNAIPDENGQVPVTVRINDAQTFLVAPEQEKLKEVPEKITPIIHLKPTTAHFIPVTALPPLTLKDPNDVHSQRFFPTTAKVVHVNLLTEPKN